MKRKEEIREEMNQIRGRRCKVERSKKGKDG
jgi:hypothetical protein